jgi:hypothetical protein
MPGINGAVKMRKRTMFLICCAIVSLAACSGNGNGGTGGGGGNGGNGGTGGSGGGGGNGGLASSPDMAMMGCPTTCGANQTCQNGNCVNLPSTCPCPVGSYCDLSSNSCKAGCLGDTDCGSGTYCNTPTRMCVAGCRVDTDCASMADVCQAHVCANQCGSCDDGNPCTLDSCNRNQCQHSAGNDNAPCADDGNPCTLDVCAAGTCSHPGGHDGTTCGDPTDSCASNNCKNGTCVHSTLPDNSMCIANGFGSKYCHSGICQAPNYLCSCSQPDAQGNMTCYTQIDGGNSSPIGLGIEPNGCNCQAGPPQSLYFWTHSSGVATEPCPHGCFAATGTPRNDLVCWSSTQ